jgi:hypothetical protein
MHVQTARVQKYWVLAMSKTVEKMKTNASIGKSNFKAPQTRKLLNVNATLF